MTTNPGKDGPRGTLATIGIVLLPILCCGVPVLVFAGGLGTVGSVLGSPYLIGGAVAVLLGVVVWRVRRHATGSADDACCTPESALDSTSERTSEHPSYPQER